VRFIALLAGRPTRQDASYATTDLSGSPKVAQACGLLLFFAIARSAFGEPTPAAVSAFNAYSGLVETRLAHQHQSADRFLAPSGADANSAEERLRQGERIIQRVQEPFSPATSAELSGAMLHHWRGTAFARGATAADFVHLMRDFNSYPQHFGPQVVQARSSAAQGNSMHAWMRIRQHHVLTVVMDTAYDVTFGQLDPRHGYSISRSTRIDEIASPGTRAERSLSSSEEHGFLWRLNTYWSYEERDGGLYLQIEAISLTRSIPGGLGWAIGPYVESIPRESLEFTLNAACKALGK
jgi:hypothetical protein